MSPRFFRRLPAATLVALLLAAPLLARGPAEKGDTSPPVLGFAVAATPSPLALSGGALRLTITVPAGYHIFGGDALAVHAKLPPGTAGGKPVYPKGAMEEQVEVLRGNVNILVPITFGSVAPPKLEGTLDLDWQACQDFGQKVCFLPTTDSVAFSLPVAASFGPSPPPAAGTTPPSPAAATPAAEEGLPAGFKERDRFAGFKDPAEFRSWLDGALGKGVGEETRGLQGRFARAAKENVPLALVLAFLFGLLSSLTPCVYPVIPITVAYIGSRSEGRPRSHGFFLSLTFVLGLASVYATLGAVSAGFGFAFGSLTSNRWVGLGVALLFLALSLSMFNLFEVRTPSALTTRLERGKQAGQGRGFLGAFFIGAISGLVASPCIGPLVLAILVVVASTGSVLLGFLYLFVYALGMGLLFVVLGTFSGVLSSLPKSGGWMDGVRVFFGALILGASFYFAGLYLPRHVFILAAVIVLWGVALFLLFGAKRHYFSVPLRAVAILLSAAALALVFLGLPAAAGPAEGGPWTPSLDQGLARARTEGKPLLIDFRADWCVACLELERETWPAPEVASALRNLVPVRLDMTENSEANRALERRFDVKGLPTVVLLAPPPRATE